jgi:8-oxo-dGTP pyrophosphatase MutT (NUDIX family)
MTIENFISFNYPLQSMKNNSITSQRRAKMTHEKPQPQPEDLTLSPDRPLLTQGAWSDGTPWNFFISNEMVDDELITAAFCIVTFQGKVAVIKQKDRGYELPGGHRELAETAVETIRRETREETGLVIHEVRLFGHKEVKPLQRVPRREPGNFYPYPTSYVLYYHAEALEFIEGALGEDVDSVELLTYAEARMRLSQSDQNHHVILEHLLQAGAINLV